MKWNQRPTPSILQFETEFEGGYAHISQYPPEEGSLVAGMFCWQVVVDHVRASVIVRTQEQAFEAVEKAIPILRETNQKLKEITP